MPYVMHSTCPNNLLHSTYFLHLDLALWTVRATTLHEGCPYREPQPGGLIGPNRPNAQNPAVIQLSNTPAVE